jgi:hypothetical protein
MFKVFPCNSGKAAHSRPLRSGHTTHARRILFYFFLDISPYVKPTGGKTLVVKPPVRQTFVLLRGDAGTTGAVGPGKGKSHLGKESWDRKSNP